LTLVSARRLGRRAEDSRSTADRLIEGIERNRQAEQRTYQRQRARRLMTVTAIAILATIIGCLVLLQRPPIDAAIHTGLPSAHSAITLTGLSGQASPVIRARLQTLVVNAGLPATAADKEASRSNELDIPVNASACRRLVTALGGSCGGLSRRPEEVRPPLILNWPRGATITEMAESSRRFQLLPPASETPRRSLSSWTSRMTAASTRLLIDCLKSSQIFITSAGVGTIGAKCVEANPVRWRLPVWFGPRDPVKDLDLLHLSYLHVQAKAQMARLEVDEALLRRGDLLRTLRARRGIPIWIGSPQHDPVDFELDVSGRPERTALSVESRSATTVSVDGDESIPTIFSRQEEIWIPVIFALAGIIATAWLDRLIGFR
jgi:hypothetical protein